MNNAKTARNFVSVLAGFGANPVSIGFQFQTVVPHRYTIALKGKSLG
jgi:hypothetical protein